MMDDFFANPMAIPTVLVVLLGAAAASLAIWLFAREQQKKVKTAEALKLARANAKIVTGKVTRFGTESADEYTVYYVFTLEGDATVYRTTSGRLSEASHGALTSPGDRVTFKVLPGYRYVEDLHNTETARA